MALISCSGIQKSFGSDVLFDNVSFEVAENDRIGLVGVNGAGKTTLFKIITGEMPRDGGEIYQNRLLNIGYIEQHTFQEAGGETVYQEVLSVFSRLIETEKELENIHNDIENKNGDIDSLIRRQHILSEQYEQGGGLTYKNRVRAALLGLGFTEKEFDLPVSVLSGGQKTKIMLGKLLLGQANFLLLDEPTNHLDIQSVEWLEDFLKSYSGAFIVISHDRYFLDKVTNRTFELENQKLTTYKGNYSYYIKKKAEDQEYLARRYENTQREISRIEGIIEQQKRWNRERNIKTAESKQKMIDRLAKDLERPESAPDGIKFSFANKQRGGDDVLIVKDLKKSFDHKCLFDNVNLHIKRGERVFLLGANGCGKTTLFKIILGLYTADTGQYKTGANIATGYYDQAQSDLDYGKTILDEVYDAYPNMTQTELRNALAAFLFKGVDVFKQISVLSGGERARVSLLKLMLSEANFLLLDEPTNHLDIHSRETLEQALQDYGGTLFIISHDRYFINKTADKVVHLTTGGADEYLGNYDYYLEKKKTDTPAVETKVKDNDYKLKKEAESARRRLLGQISRIEAEIEVNEDNIRQMEERLSLPEYSSDYIKTLEITNEIEGLKKALETQYQTWDELQQKLTQMQESI